jgi:hypothetical protein
MAIVFQTILKIRGVESGAMQLAAIISDSVKKTGRSGYQPIVNLRRYGWSFI